MPRVAWSPTEEDLQKIKDMSEKGMSQKAIHEALGIHYSTWRKYRDGLEENNENITPIKKALEEGKEKGLLEKYKRCMNTLDTITQIYTLSEKHVYKKTVNGSVQVEEKEIHREQKPDTAAVIFEVINAASELREMGYDVRKLINPNRVEVKQEQHNNGLKIELVDSE